MIPKFGSRSESWASAANLVFFRFFLLRFIQQPFVESRRVWIYVRNSDRRQAFLTFQYGAIKRKSRLVEKLVPLEPVSLSNSTCPSTLGLGESHERLSELLIQHGSDKATTHDYDTIYRTYARLAGLPTRVVEIGLGTIGSGPSSMGSGGHPGASVRAFRDWGAEVIGADIDRSILVNEPGIKTYFVDQLRPRSLQRFVSHLPKSVDLAIVDGLHTPEADLNSLLVLAPRLSARGLLVVEDIETVPEVADLWCTVLRALAPGFRATLIKTKASAVLLLVRKENRVVPELTDLYPNCEGAIFETGRQSG